MPAVPATTSPVPLFPGMPGGAELVILLLVVLILVAPLVIVAGLVVAGVWVFGGSDDEDEDEATGERDEPPR